MTTLVVLAQLVASVVGAVAAIAVGVLLGLIAASATLRPRR